MSPHVVLGPVDPSQTQDSGSCSGSGEEAWGSEGEGTPCSHCSLVHQAGRLSVSTVVAGTVWSWAGPGAVLAF